ncbi:MAG TPA: biotin carboxylase N-terminal domain-containing protein, partial [Ramlibacter sp.]
MRRLLIANRGEISRRIIRTAHRMGIETVAVYSDADARALHVRETTAAFALGG